MSNSQDHIIIEVEDENTMDTENEEETKDPEEDFMTKLKNNIPDLMRNAGIAGLELSTNNYMKAASSVLHLAGDLYKSANDSKTRKELKDVKEREKRVFDREKKCEEKEQRVFEREQICQQMEERNFERENRFHQMEDRMFEREKRCQDIQKESLTEKRY